MPDNFIEPLERCGSCRQLVGQWLSVSITGAPAINMCPLCLYKTARDRAIAQLPDLDPVSRHRAIAAVFIETRRWAEEQFVIFWDNRAHTEEEREEILVALA